MTNSKQTRRYENCSICGAPMTEVQKSVTGVCPIHGVQHGEQAVTNREQTQRVEGLHEKYHGLRRVCDDSGVKDWYFVLCPYNSEKGNYDSAALVALDAYANVCESYEPELAADLRKQIKGFREERRWQLQYLAEWER